MAKCLVVILTWNNIEGFAKTYDRFVEVNHINMEHYDVLVVDNGSVDGTCDYLKFRNIEYLSLESNEGVYFGTKAGWLSGLQIGYDFILNLQDDFPSKRYVPFLDLFEYLDENKDIALVRLNSKKDKRKNLITQERIKYSKPEYLNEKYSISKNNYHFSFNPTLIRSSIIPQILDDDKPREGGIMKAFEKTGMSNSKIYPECFRTLPQGKHNNGWKN